MDFYLLMEGSSCLIPIKYQFIFFQQRKIVFTALTVNTGFQFEGGRTIEALRSHSHKNSNFVTSRRYCIKMKITSVGSAKRGEIIGFVIKYAPLVKPALS